MSTLSPTGRVEALSCPSCGQDLQPDDVNIELMVAMCRGCASMVELAPARTPRGTGAERAVPPAELLKLVSPPAGITIQERGEHLILKRRWFELGPRFLFTLLWCTVWDGFLVVWYSVSIVGLLSGEGGAVATLLFPMLHVAAGIAVTYWLVATAVNNSTLEVGPSHLKVSHGPLPWRAPDPVPVKSIDQLYVVSKNDQGYTVVARRTDRTSVELLGGLTRDVQARFLEQRIEAHLGLADQAVAGEYTG